MSKTVNQEEMKQKCEHEQECMKKIQAILDGDATPEEIEYFKQHNLQTCLPCVNNYALELEVKKMLQQKVEKKCCPKTIAYNIKTKLGFAMLILMFLFLEVHLYRIMFS